MRTQLQAFVRNAAKLRDEISRLMSSYSRRLQVVEERLREGYNPVLEREAAKLSELLRILRVALALASEAERLARNGFSIGLPRVMELVEKANELRERVLYGPVHVPIQVRVVVMKLYYELQKLAGVVSSGLESSGQLV